MNATTRCPNSPLGHDWTKDRLSCGWCDARRSASDALRSVASSQRGVSQGDAEELCSAIRAEVLREAADRMAELLKETPEYGPWVADQLRRMADEAATEKATPTGEATPDFFQPGRTYRSRRCGDFQFRCLAIDTHPDTGVLRAFGWRYSARPNVWRPTDLDADDWSCCGWADVTDGGDR